MRGLIHKPQLLLFENPWSALNTESRESIEHYVLNELPTTTVIVAVNDVSFASKCDQVIVLEKGFLRGTGKINEVIHLLN